MSFNHEAVDSSATRSPGRLVKAGVVLAASAGLLGLMSGAASATPTNADSGSTTANAQVQEGITLTGLTPSFTLTGTPGETVTGPEAVSYNVETNSTTGYGVTVEAADSVMSPSIVGNSDTIPVSVLTVREAGATSYQALSDNGVAVVHTQGVRSANGGDSLASDFQMRMPVVNADTYSVTLNYVATSAL